MKHMSDGSGTGNNDSPRSSLHSDNFDSPTPNGRRLDIEEDSPFSDLVSIYACSDQAQLAAMCATSGVFVREVAHYLGLAGPISPFPTTSHPW